LESLHKMKVKYFAVDLLRFFCCVKKPTPEVPQKIKSMAILTPERYGDLILLTPLIKNLRHRFPDMHITLVGVNDLVFFFKADRYVQHIHNGKKMLYRFRSRLFTETFDMLYNPKDHPSFVFLLLTCRLKAAHKIAIAHPLHRQFYHTQLPVKAEWSKLQINCALLSLLEIHADGNNLRPYLPQAPISEEIKRFARQHIPAGTLAINLSASRWIRRWPSAHWQLFLNQVQVPVIILAMPQQAAEKRQLEDQCNIVIASPPTKTLFDAAHLIAGCRLLISPDTALIHVASALNKPVIGLYTYRSAYTKFAALSDIQEILFSENDTIQSITPQHLLAAYVNIEKQITSTS
jgi:heptosyltransferase-3